MLFFTYFLLISRILSMYSTFSRSSFFFVVCAFALTHNAKLSQIIQIKGVKPKKKLISLTILC